MLDFPSASYIICGDLNTRIGNQQDLLPYDDLDHVFGENVYPTDEFNSPRNNKETIISKFGKTPIGHCCTHDVHILNGRLSHDKSVVNYFIMSTSLFNNVIHHEVSHIL